MSKNLIHKTLTLYVHYNIQKYVKRKLISSRVNSLSVALRAGYLSVRTAEGASEKQSSLKARLRNGLTYLLSFLLLTYLLNKSSASSDRSISDWRAFT